MLGPSLLSKKLGMDGESNLNKYLKIQKLAYINHNFEDVAGLEEREHRASI